VGQESKQCGIHSLLQIADIDIIIPANHDVEIRGAYDGNVTFRIDYHRGVKRMALTAHNSTQVDAEYIFPTRPSQKPRYVEYGAGPVVCFSARTLGSWATFVFEHWIWAISLQLMVTMTSTLSR
jgi:hypothetical protein